VTQIAPHPRLELLLDKAYVGGRWIDADDGTTFPVVDPATGEELAHLPRLGAAETRAAIAAAEAAYPAWRATVAKDRAKIMRRWADLMLEHLDDLALLLTTEQGKPLAASRTAVA
jgi:succinate-semialdehyde dehydrogenase/glutarate-semialdehyde dehydrogenase